jgi:NAD dependent epimerase/dehydratase family enzyme
MYQKNIVILGGGSKTCKLFLKKKFLSKYKISIFSKNNKKKNLRANNNFFLDINNKTFVTEITKANFIINFVGESTNEKKMFNANILFSKILTQNIKKFNKTCKVIHISSIAVYHDFTKINKLKIIIDEKSSLNPFLKYPRTKYFGEKYFLNNFGNRTHVLRPAQILGHTELNTSIDRIIYYLKFNLFFFVGNKNFIWTYIPINDLLLCINTILQKSYFPKVINLVENIPMFLLIDKIKKKYKIFTINITIPFFLAKIFLKLNTLLFNGRLPFNQKVYHALTANLFFDNSLLRKNIKKKKHLENEII